MALPCNTCPIVVFSYWNCCLVNLKSRVLTLSVKTNSKCRMSRVGTVCLSHRIVITEGRIYSTKLPAVKKLKVECFIHAFIVIVGLLQNL